MHGTRLERKVLRIDMKNWLLLGRWVGGAAVAKWREAFHRNRPEKPPTSSKKKWQTKKRTLQEQKKKKARAEKVRKLN